VLPGPGQERANLIVRCLIEVAVELTDGVELLRSLKANKLADFAAQIVASAAGRNRNRNNESLGQRMQSARCGPHGGSGGQSVVDEDHAAAVEMSGQASFAVCGLATRDLLQFAGSDRVNDLGTDVKGANDFVLHDHEAAAGHSAHGQFLLAGDAELAHHEHIERQIEFLSDFEGDRNAAPRQGKHDGILAAQVIAKLVAKDLYQGTAGVPTILKDGDHALPFCG